MRSHLLRTMIAEWTWRVVIAAGTLALTTWIVAFTWRGATESVWSFCLFVFVVAVSIITGLFGSAFLGGMSIVAFVFAWLARWNGAPFVVGDRVTILVGPHRGTVSRIYDVWPSRHQLRVELGDELKKAVCDVYSRDEVCRAS